MPGSASSRARGADLLYRPRCRRRRCAGADRHRQLPCRPGGRPLRGAASGRQGPGGDDPHDPGDSSTSARQRGFVQAVRAAGLAIVFDRHLGDPPQATLEALVQELPRLDALFTPNGSSTRQVYAALLRLQSAGRVLHLGFDADPLLLEALGSGQIAALMVQQPYRMGYQGVLLAHQALREKRLEPRRREVELEAVLVTRDNLDSPSIRALLAPLERR
ncbi:substrate-binding domain-containing protein [Pseudomonas lalucatii]|nr:substrate-binding domain-containing protein [Pseudomonas lalucatii]